MKSPSTKIRVMLVEDHLLIRMGLLTVSQIEPDIELVGQVEVGEEAVGCFRECRPDVVIMDIRLSGGIDGIQTIALLRKECPTVPVLVMSSSDKDDDIFRAVQARARGYLLKGMPLGTLIEAIRTVHGGREYFPPGISERLASRLRQAALTEREITVLQAIANGNSNKEIGSAFGITEGTVKAHISNILAKLEVADRTQAVTTALKRGLIHLE